MADSGKQAALVESIAVGVLNKMTPEFAALSEQIAKLAVTLGAVQARLVTLESAVGSGGGGGTAPKRTVRTAGAGAPAGAKPAAAKKAVGDEESKLTNSLLYFRWQMAHDLEARETYASGENLEAVAQDATVLKKEAESPDYWKTVGAAIWKTRLTEEEKKAVKASFDEWKEARDRDLADPQLDEAQ